MCRCASRGQIRVAQGGSGHACSGVTVHKFVSTGSKRGHLQSPFQGEVSRSCARSNIRTMAMTLVMNSPSVATPFLSHTNPYEMSSWLMFDKSLFMKAKRSC